MLLIGDGGVGKTSLLFRYSDQIFNESVRITIGVDFKIKEIELDNERIKLQIWDTTLNWLPIKETPQGYFKGQQGIIFVYDCCSEKSFENIKIWNDLANKYSSKNVRKVIVGNKCDRSDKAIEKIRGEELAQK